MGGEWRGDRSEKKIQMISCYRQFVPNFTQDSSYLTSATSKSSPTVVQWSLEMEDDFHRLVSKLCDLTIFFVFSHPQILQFSTQMLLANLGAILSRKRGKRDSISILQQTTLRERNTIPPLNGRLLQLFFILNSSCLDIQR